MRNLFNSVRLKPVKRNPFSFHYSNDFTTEYGNITPVQIFDTYAGEIFKLSNESFIRTQPLRCPAFMQADVSYHWFFVPHRLVYEDWSKFIVRGRDGDTDYDKPYATIYDLAPQSGQGRDQQYLTNGSLYDFLNFPTFGSSGFMQNVASAGNYKVDMMPFNAYNLIYNEYYRDENLQPEVFIWKKSGRTDNVTDYSDYRNEIISEYGPKGADFVTPWKIRRRAWRKDYFTSALPFVQKGTPISIAGNVTNGGLNYIPVQFVTTPLTSTQPSQWFLGVNYLNGEGDENPYLYAFSKTAGPTGISDVGTHTHNAHSTNSNVKPATAYISLDDMQANVMTISNLRTGLALMQWFELNARTGSDRYFEYLLGHFGVRDRDSRLQRPEYIGGYSHSIQISEVEQNSSTDNVTPQGNLAGRGLGFSANRPCVYRCPEPGWIIQLQSIRPRAVYYQGWPRMYQRWDAFDYYDPLFDHLSEQSIKKSELFFDPSVEPFSSSDPDFGYTPRFSEYRTMLSECHGDMRGDLSYWISPRVISNAVQLDSNFISIDGYRQKLYESFAYIGTSANPTPHFICHLVNHVKCIRPMSRYATPGL